jgi:hypothetical protein
VPAVVRLTREFPSGVSRTAACGVKETVMTYALWIVQGLLALTFLWAGGVKLVLPLEQLKGPIELPAAFIRFLGVAEVLGALGLVLPGLLHIRPGLTPLAATGLAIIMLGATAFGVVLRDVAMTLIPLVIGLLCTFVAWGRSRTVMARRATPDAAAPAEKLRRSA